MANNFQSETSQRIYTTAINPYFRPGSPNTPIQGVPDFIAKCLVGQSKFETADYHNSFIPERCYFSYSYTPKSVWQIPGGGKVADNHVPVAKYSSLEDSVHEMTDWLYRRQKDGKFPANLNTITSALQYATLLQQCGFFQGWSKYTHSQNLHFYANGIQKGIDDKI